MSRSYTLSVKESRLSSQLWGLIFLLAYTVNGQEAKQMASSGGFKPVRYQLSMAMVRPATDGLTPSTYAMMKPTTAYWPLLCPSLVWTT